jgi:hypothetical protein
MYTSMLIRYRKKQDRITGKTVIHKISGKTKQYNPLYVESINSAATAFGQDYKETVR